MQYRPEWQHHYIKHDEMIRCLKASTITLSELKKKKGHAAFYVFETCLKFGQTTDLIQGQIQLGFISITMKMKCSVIMCLLSGIVVWGTKIFKPILPCVNNNHKHHCLILAHTSWQNHPHWRVFEQQLWLGHSKIFTYFFKTFKMWTCWCILNNWPAA